MRNTYDSKNPFTKNNPAQESKQRETYTNPNPKLMSFQKQAQTSNVSGPLNNQKMTKFILDTLKRLHLNFQNKVFSLNTFKPNQKTLLNTIGILLNSFDQSFEEGSLNIQMLPQLLRSLGYPNVINKTYFQPVGAPHTWSQCLAMMEWLAELAAFHIEIRGHLEDECFKADFTTLLIQSYLDQTPEIPKTQLQNQIKRKNITIEDHRYTINTLNLSIQNLKSLQKDLNVLQEEQKRFESILSREKQQTIQVNQQNMEMERKLKDLQYKIEEQKKISQIKDDQISSLYYQIQNQELSVEQVQRIRFQIKQYHDKITQVKRYYENQKQNLDKADANLISQYIEFSKTLEALRQLHRKHKHQMEKRNIYLQIPECDISTFTYFIKNRKDDCSDVKIEQIIQTKEIKEIKDKAEVLLNLVNLQLKNFDEKREQINSQNRLLNEESLEKDLKLNELHIALDSVTTKLQNSRRQIQYTKTGNDQIKNQVSILENEMKKTETQVEKVIEELEQLMSYSKELRELKVQIQKNSIQSIQRVKTSFQNYKAQTLEVLSYDYQYFEQCAQAEEYNCQNNIQNIQGNVQQQGQHQNIQLNQVQNTRYYPELKEEAFQLRDLDQYKYQTQIQNSQLIRQKRLRNDFQQQI